MCGEWCNDLVASSPMARYSADATSSPSPSLARSDSAVAQGHWRAATIAPPPVRARVPHPGIAPLRRRLDGDQLVGRLGSFARLRGGGSRGRNSVGQATACRQRPTGRQRQAGVHEQVVGRYTRRGFGCRFIGFSRLAELGVSFGQREATRRGQTRWHAVSLGPGKRFMQEFHRVVRGAAEGWSA
ncbi:MAG: hypothetical protein JWP83_4279 [Mycobacterium sp.]|jgi:hypothetical protein|nr:hypothetical protein [Mycobacterium sp.]